MNRLRFATNIFLFALLCAGCSRVDSVVKDKLYPDGGEYWETLSIDGRPVGFQQTQIFQEAIAGKLVRRFELQSRLTVLRHGSPFDVAMKQSSLMEPNGVFISSTTQLLGGSGEPMETKCKTDGDRILLIGSRNQTPIPAKSGTLGPDAVIWSLLQKPMLVGEKRQISFFDPSLAQIVDSNLHAARLEKISVGGKKSNLLRINLQNKFGAGATQRQLGNTLWTDAGGNIVQSEMPMDGKESILARRTDKATVDAQLEKLTKTPEVEMGTLGVVPLDQTIYEPLTTKQLTFIVRTEIGSPADRIPNTPFQSVKQLGPQIARITVWSAADPNVFSSGNPDFKSTIAQSKPEELASNRWIDWKDPELLKLAATIPSFSTQWETARALEILVHDYVKPDTFSIAFASSTDVMKSKTGDCTEYAILLAALCRSQGIPTRLALGLVYTPIQGGAAKESNESHESKRVQGAMSFHLWNEVLVNGIWRPLDATLGLGGADAARIKLADTSLAEESPVPLTQAVLGSIGQFQINVGSTKSPDKEPAKPAP